MVHGFFIFEFFQAEPVSGLNYKPGPRPGSKFNFSPGRKIRVARSVAEPCL